MTVGGLTRFSSSLQPTARVHADVLSELVRPSIDYVRHKKFRSGNFPSSLSNESDRLVHWCHGAPGVVHMLLMAHKVRVHTHTGPLWRGAALHAQDGTTYPPKLNSWNIFVLNPTVFWFEEKISTSMQGNVVTTAWIHTKCLHTQLQPPTVGAFHLFLAH